MTSKIVVNNIEPDAGISTVSILGIATATKFIGDVEGDVTGSGANLTSIPAGQLTGTIPDARISASSVQQHASSFDDNKIVNDISALALKINGIQNATRYNTNSTSVETFQDANGIASLTGMARDTTGGEYVASIIQSYGTDQYWSTSDLDANRIYNYNGTSIDPAGMIDGVTGSIGGGQGQTFYIAGPMGLYTQGLGYELGADSDFGVGFKLTGFQFYNFNTYARFRFFKIQTADSGGSSGSFTSQNITASGFAQDNSDDIVEATFLCSLKTPTQKNQKLKKNDYVPHKIFNIGYGSTVNLLEFINLLEDALQKKAIKVFEPMHEGDVVKTFANIEKLKDWIQFQPKVSIEKGVRNFANWYLNYFA